MPPGSETIRQFIGKDIVFVGGSEVRHLSFQAGLRCEWDAGSSKWINCFPSHECMCIVCRKMDCFVVVYPLDVPSTPGVALNPHVHASRVLPVVAGAEEQNGVTGIVMLFFFVGFVCWAATCIAIGMVGTQNGRLLYGMCKQRTSLTYPPDSNRRET